MVVRELPIAPATPAGHDGIVLTERELAAGPGSARLGLVARPITPSPPASGAEAASPAPRHAWRRSLPLPALDGLAGVAALAIAGGWRGGVATRTPHLLLAISAALLWPAALRLSGVYQEGRLATWRTEFGRIANAGAWALAAVVVGSYVTHAGLSPQAVALTVPVMVGLTLTGHAVSLRLRHHRVRGGVGVHRVVVAGSRTEVRGLVEHIAHQPHSGLTVAGVCLPAAFGHPPSAPGSPPLVGTVADVIGAARRTGADTIAIAGSSTLSGAAVRRLSWDLEGTGIRLLVAWGAPELAGRRLLVQFVGGLPLLHVRPADFSGPSTMAKAAIDRVGAGLLLVAAAPLLAVVALAVRATSRGPVLFRQTRVGLGGRPFTILKFRTMCDGADADQHHLSRLNEHDGLLYKLRLDPRVTRVGAILRRLSLDELPQLWNVLTGSMSLVGPRPPLPNEVDRYPGDLRRRRHLVKPGITGLWQVSGRSDLSPEETVRLDLHYVENWSVALDTLVLWKTVRAVLSSRGAY